MPLQEFVKLCRPEKNQRGWGQRRKDADLSDKNGSHGQTMEEVTGCNSTQNGGCR